MHFVGGRCINTSTFYVFRTKREICCVQTGRGGSVESMREECLLRDSSVVKFCKHTVCLVQEGLTVCVNCARQQFAADKCPFAQLALLLRLVPGRHGHVAACTATSPIGPGSIPSRGTCPVTEPHAC